MSEVPVPDSRWRLSRVSGAAVVLRVLVLTGAVVAMACTRLAAGRTVPLLDIVILGFALVCAVLPDSHVGLVVVLFVGIEWLATVHDRTTPWSVGVAVALVVFHTSMAAATVAPSAARWTRAMCRRWMRRSAVVMVASAGTWVIVVAARGHHASATVLVAASLIALAIAGLWGREGSFNGRSRPP